LSYLQTFRGGTDRARWAANSAPQHLTCCCFWAYAGELRGAGAAGPPALHRG
jgi:hypothetical protein